MARSAGPNQKRKSDPAKTSALSEAAASKSYDSVQDGLQLLAKEMHLACPYLKEQQVDDLERNNQPQVEHIERILRMISADATNLSLTLHKIQYAGTMAPDVSTVAGAWTVCRHDLEAAHAWYKANGGSAITGLSEVERSIKDMITTVHGDPNTFKEDRAEPQGNPKEMSDHVFDDQLDAANKSVDALVAGSKDEDERLAAIVRHIGVKGQYSEAFKRHRSKVVKLKQRLMHILKENTVDSKATLNDAVWALEGALK